MQRQFIQQAIVTVLGEGRGMSLPRHFSHEARYPLDPERVSYRRSHPFRVKRLSAKVPEGHFTGVISCSSSQGKKTI